MKEPYDFYKMTYSFPEPLNSLLGEEERYMVIASDDIEKAKRVKPSIYLGETKINGIIKDVVLIRRNKIKADDTIFSTRINEWYKTLWDFEQALEIFELTGAK